MHHTSENSVRQRASAFEAELVAYWASLDHAARDLLPRVLDTVGQHADAAQIRAMPEFRARCSHACWNMNAIATSARKSVSTASSKEAVQFVETFARLARALDRETRHVVAAVLEQLWRDAAACGEC